MRAKWLKIDWSGSLTDIKPLAQFFDVETPLSSVVVLPKVSASPYVLPPSVAITPIPREATRPMTVRTTPSDVDLAAIVRKGVRVVDTGCSAYGETIQIDDNWYIVSVERSVRYRESKNDG